jgi:hypothetical protein
MRLGGSPGTSDDRLLMQRLIVILPGIGNEIFVRFRIKARLASTAEVVN